MGNHEETFKSIGRTIQLYKSLGELGPIIKDITATQSNLCTMEPATFLHDIIKLAGEMNKFEAFHQLPRKRMKQKRVGELENKR